MASGPPFYRLGMTKGSGQGASSDEATPMDTFQEGYDKGLEDGNPIGGGGGAVGPLSYDSGPAGLTFGDISPGATMTIDFSGVGGGFYAGRLVFTSPFEDDRTFFQVNSLTVNGLTLTPSTPHNCGDGDFAFSFDEPDAGSATASVTFEALFADTTEQAMTVDIYDIDGSLVDSITATATMADPVIAAVQAVSGTLAIYSPRDTADGAVAPSATLATDVLNTVPEPLLRAVLTGWSVQDSGLTVDSVSKSMRVSETGGSAPLKTAALISDMSGTYDAGLIVLKTNVQFDNVGGNGWMEIWKFSGNVSNLNPISAANAACINWRDAANWHQLSRPATGFGQLTSTPYPDPTVGQWWVIAFRKNAGTTYVYERQVGQSGGLSFLQSTATAWTEDAGMALFSGKSAQFTSDFVFDTEIACIIPLAGATEQELNDIYNSIS